MGSPPDPHRLTAPLPGEEVERWVQRYGPALRRYFQKKVTATEADDLVQNVFLAIHARGEGAGDIENVEGYIFRTAANVLARRFGRDGWNPEALGDAYQPADEVSPERALIGKQELERAAAILEALPPRTRQAFMLHRFEEMTYVSIARKMGITKVAVGKLIKRAMLRLGEGDGRHE
jgi:RNA polymerase sigma factor (sigma-70 family)